MPPRRRTSTDSPTTARRSGALWSGVARRQPPYEWQRRLARADSVLAADDRIVFRESLALPEYKRSRRDEKAFHRLSAARPPQVAVVAVAREQVGFLWAVMRDAPEPLGYLPPAEYEAQYCAARSDSAALELK